MSIDATRWAWKQTNLRPMQKLVLLSLADRAGADDCCYPSKAMLVQDTGIDPKTVWSALKELSEMGLILDTGRRVGHTKQIPVWHLVGVESRHGKNSETGRVPDTEGFQNYPESIPKTERKAFQKRNTEPTKEPIKEPTNTSSSLKTREASQEDKQPGGASSGGDGPHNSEPAKPVDSAKSKKKSAISRNWEPDAECLDLLEKAGISREFSESLVGEFRLYWNERGDKRPGWNATFLNHAKVQWTRQQERPKSGTILTPYRSGAVHPPSRAGGDFRTISEMRAQRNIEIALEFANELNERVINE